MRTSCLSLSPPAIRIALCKFSENLLIGFFGLILIIIYYTPTQCLYYIVP